MSTASPAITTHGPRKRHWLRYALACAAVILGILYFTGRMDYALYPVGLNFHTCARNGLGATFCGSDLTQYERRWQGVQQQIQQAQQAAQRAECQADPSLSICGQP